MLFLMAFSLITCVILYMYMPKDTVHTIHTHIYIYIHTYIHIYIRAVNRLNI